MSITFGYNYIDSKKKNCETFADSLNINSQYLITGNDGSHFEGTLSGQDSIRIFVKNKSGKEFSILWSQVAKIQDNSGNTVYQSAEILEIIELDTTKDYVNHHDSTDVCTIILNSENLLKDVRIVDSNDSTFTITKDHFNKTFNISGINSVEFEQHGFWKGFLYGGVGSIALWTVAGFIAYRTYDEYDARGVGFVVGAILAIPSGLITGAICEFLSKNDIYNFNNINYAVKSKRLRYIRGKHKY